MFQYAVGVPCCVSVNTGKSVQRGKSAVCGEGARR